MNLTERVHHLYRAASKTRIDLDEERARDSIIDLAAGVVVLENGALKRLNRGAVSKLARDRGLSHDPQATRDEIADILCRNTPSEKIAEVREQIAATRARAAEARAIVNADRGLPR